METIIVYTQVNLVNFLCEKLQSIEGWKVYSEPEGIDAIFNSNEIVRIYYCDIEDTVSPPIKLIKKFSLGIYSISCRDISRIKMILRNINCSNTWIFNNFDNTNYACHDFVSKMDSDKDWDWRVSS